MRIGFEATEETIEESEMFGATQFDKEDEVGGLSMVEVVGERLSQRFLWP